MKDKVIQRFSEQVGNRTWDNYSSVTEEENVMMFTGTLLYILLHKLHWLRKRGFQPVSSNVKIWCDQTTNFHKVRKTLYPQARKH